MKNLSLLFVSVLTFGVIFLSSCGDDELPPNTAVVKGTVIMDNNDVWATWIDSGEVQITIFPEFNLNPPAGWGEIPDGALGPNVPGGTFAIGAPFNSQNPVVIEYEAGKNEYEFEIEVDPGTYSALAVGFRHNFVNDPSLRSATLGVYHNNPNDVSHGIVIKADVGGGTIVPIYDFPAPSSFTVADGETLELEFRADFGFVNQWYR